RRSGETLFSVVDVATRALFQLARRWASGAQRAAPKDRPAGFHSCARPAKLNPPPRAVPSHGAAGKDVNRACFALPSGIPRTQYPPPEAADKLKAPVFSRGFSTRLPS